jgi:hypothetical protein
LQLGNPSENVWKTERRYLLFLECATSDGKLEVFRGGCGFRHYILSKPSKYKIKTFALVDACLFYTCNMEIYMGTLQDDPYKQSNRPSDAV